MAFLFWVEERVGWRLSERVLFSLLAGRDGWSAVDTFLVGVRESYLNDRAVLTMMTCIRPAPSPSLHPTSGDTPLARSTTTSNDRNRDAPNLHDLRRDQPSGPQRLNRLLHRRRHRNDLLHQRHRNPPARYNLNRDTLSSSPNHQHKSALLQHHHQHPANPNPFKHLPPQPPPGLPIPSLHHQRRQSLKLYRRHNPHHPRLLHLRHPALLRGADVLSRLRAPRARHDGDVRVQRHGPWGAVVRCWAEAFGKLRGRGGGQVRREEALSCWR